MFLLGSCNDTGSFACCKDPISTSVPQKLLLNIETESLKILSILANLFLRTDRPLFEMIEINVKALIGNDGYDVIADHTGNLMGTE